MIPSVELSKDETVLFQLGDLKTIVAALTSFANSNTLSEVAQEFLNLEQDL